MNNISTIMILLAEYNFMKKEIEEKTTLIVELRKDKVILHELIKIQKETDEYTEDTESEEEDDENIGKLKQMNIYKIK